MIRYLHGSEDSIDNDYYYVFDKIPDYNTCRKFCSENPNENRNIITINNGIVTDCFIGTVDEINNGLIDTYNLHEQEYSLLITERIKRDVLLKMIRANRGIISILSRTQYRDSIKYALKTGYKSRIDCTKIIDFNYIDFDKLNKRYNKKDSLKIIAFQLGQSLALNDNIECYTKSSITNLYPDLKPFLYRYDIVDTNILNIYRDKLYDIMKEIEVEEHDNICKFVNINRIFDLKHEVEIYE